jgi:hypothetical protein
MTDEYAQDFAASHASLAKVRAKMPRAVKYHPDAGGEAPPETQPPGAPVNTVKPRITGQPVLGGTLQCSTGTWDTALTRDDYQWRHSAGSVVFGDNASTVQLGDGEVGHMIECKVTGTNTSGSTSVITDLVGPVQDV